MKISIQDLAQMHRDFYEANPRDLVEDLSDEDPQLAQDSIQLDTLLAQKRQELKVLEAESEMHQPEFWTPVPPVKKTKPQPILAPKPVFAQDTIVARGWNDMRIKGTKNWADFENLIALYTLGKLFDAENMPTKAKQDKAELTYVVEEFDRLKRPQVKKHYSAEKRLQADGAYFMFGKRTIDASCIPNLSARAETLNDLEDTYMEAMDNNEYNGWKLKKAYHIARRVIRTLRQRY